jgi:hypothetical protein
MNRGSDSILSVYSDARAEYTKQLCVFLVPAYFQFFIELLDKAKQDMVNEPKRVLWHFQTYLNEIHDWNMEKVKNEIQRIQTNSGCDYLEDLLTAVFIAHTKVLTAIRLSSNKKKVDINVPRVEHFLFKVLCETSKLLWSSTYLFRDGISGVEKQQNYRNIEQILNEGILQAVRSLVPVKSILKDFVGGESEGADEDDSDDEEDKVENKDEVNTEVPKINEEFAVPGSEQPIHMDIPINEPKSIVPEPSVNLPVVNEPVVTKEEETPKNEIVIPSQTSVPQTSVPQTSVSQTIVIEDKPNVRFGEFDAVFDMGNPMDSDMIYEPKDEEHDIDETPALEILDEVGAPLSEGIDFDDLNDKKSDDEGLLGEGDYEVLS